MMLTSHIRRVFLAAILICLNTQAADAPPLTIGLIGDSTVASTYGWGPSFAKLFNERTRVLNYAKNGATLQSLSAKLDELLTQHPDFVFIQFGHNDQKKYDPAVYTVELTSYVERVKKAGAMAVVFSSVTRRVFAADGKIVMHQTGMKGDLRAYGEAAGKVAAAQQVPFIDLYGISVAHHNKIGPAASAAYNFNPTDATHFSPEGADAIAALIVGQLKTAVPAAVHNLK